jgi:hypothetical protein
MAEVRFPRVRAEASQGERKLNLCTGMTGWSVNLTGIKCFAVASHGISSASRCTTPISRLLRATGGQKEFELIPPHRTREEAANLARPRGLSALQPSVERARLHDMVKAGSELKGPEDAYLIGPADLPAVHLIELGVRQGPNIEGSLHAMHFRLHAYPRSGLFRHRHGGFSHIALFPRRDPRHGIFEIWRNHAGNCGKAN